MGPPVTPIGAAERRIRIAVLAVCGFAIFYAWIVLLAMALESAQGAKQELRALGPGMDLLGLLPQTWRDGLVNFYPSFLFSGSAEGTGVNHHHQMGHDMHFHDESASLILHPGAHFLTLLPMWIAMIFAMMLPAAVPMLCAYQDIAVASRARGRKTVPVFVLAAGYLTVWGAFAIFAAALQTGLMRASLLNMEAALPGHVLAVCLLLIAAAFQVSRLKYACLYHCRNPMSVFFSSWSDRLIGVYRMGLHEGVTCLGCCWALMLLMFAAGTMNIVCMAVLTILMCVEKLTRGKWPQYASALALVAIAVMILIEPASLEL